MVTRLFSMGWRQGFQRRPGELRQLVLEQYAVVGQADLAGTGIGAAAGEPCR